MCQAILFVQIVAEHEMSGKGVINKYLSNIVYFFTPTRILQTMIRI